MSIIFAYCTDHVGNFFHAFVRSFTHSAGIRIIDESRLEYAIQDMEYGMMKDAVLHRSFVDSPELWVMNPKSFVLPVLVCLFFQISVQIKNILFKIQLKFCNIRLVPFVGLEYLPRAKQRLGRNYRPI